ncbi:MAG: dUTP diphosphatase [Patescibacteria group bacterium]
MSLAVSFKRFDQDVPAPEYATEDAAALDLSARLTVTIKPRQIGYVPLNIALQLPQGYWALLAARSSLHKRGVMMANGIGVGDYDFRGDSDEYQAALLNFTDQPVIIERGDRIVQLLVLSREPVELHEADAFDSENRGGFGSTGK